MQAIINSPQFIAQVPYVQNEESCVIRIEMLDGTSQFVQLALDQTPPPVQLQTVAHHVNYKIVQPAELNLCAIDSNGVVPRAPLPRGRPKKRPNTSPIPVNKSEIDAKVSRFVKTCRTRSGRITRPPIMLERDFEKIVIDAKPSKISNDDINTVEFEPLPTKNTAAKEPVLVSLAASTRKRLIPSQYRCRACKKAYLGRAKMERHLLKHPDHRLVNPINVDDCKTWCCLVDTALKASKGQRGNAFCRELNTLIRNARTLVKYFFKEAKQHNVEYDVDTFLAQVLDIKAGPYRFNENELCKDLSIFSLLFFNEDGDANERNQDTTQFGKSNIEGKSNDDENKLQVDANVQSDEKSKANTDLHFDSDLIDGMRNNPMKHSQAENGCDSDKDGSEEQHAVKNEFIHMFHNDFIAKMPKADKPTYEPLFENNLYSSSSSMMVLPDENNDTARSGKEVDIYRNTIKNIIDFGASDENMSTIMDKEKKKKRRRKSDDFDLNKLHLDEFHFSEPPVTNVLDTSTGSDEMMMMNVDQFVNERFKKLTEAEIEDLPPSGSLQLDLPPLECFNFSS